MIVALDNARYHHVMLLSPFLRQNIKQLRLLWQPQLASIERAWKPARRLVTHNRYLPTPEDVVKAVRTRFDRRRRPNRLLIRPCCITWGAMFKSPNATSRPPGKELGESLEAQSWDTEYESDV